MPLTKGQADGHATRVQALARRMFARQEAYARVVVVWERVYDPVRARSYYYNVLTDCAQWTRPSPLLWREIEEVSPTFTAEQAVLLIQCASRRLLRVRVARNELVKVLSKVFEEESGTSYYFNSKTGATSWTKPRMLGRYDVEDGELVGGDSAELERARGDDDEGSSEEDAESGTGARVGGTDDESSKVEDSEDEASDDEIPREWSSPAPSLARRDFEKPSLFSSREREREREMKRVCPFERRARARRSVG